MILKSGPTLVEMISLLEEPMVSARRRTSPLLFYPSPHPISIAVTLCTSMQLVCTITVVGERGLGRTGHGSGAPRCTKCTIPCGNLRTFAVSWWPARIPPLVVSTRSLMLTLTSSFSIFDFSWRNGAFGSLITGN